MVETSHVCFITHVHVEHAVDLILSDMAVLINLLSAFCHEVFFIIIIVLSVILRRI